jgi:DNA-binding NtrC family response regulator
VADTRLAADLLLVDDDAELRSTVAAFFRRSGYAVEESADAPTALGILGQRSFDAAVFDMRMPGLSGVALLEKLRAAGNELPVVILTGEATVESAVESMKLGAADYVMKPVRLKELESVIARAIERDRLRKENVQLREVLRRKDTSPEIIGGSPPMQEMFRLIARVGPTDKAILIQGESGTGKELVAQALHRVSPLRDKPLVTINCAALPESLLESELFGHEKGAFTGAAAAKPGLFEVADGGTLFIDEAGELALPLQAKLLRVLEDGSLRRVGSVTQRKVRVRLLAATNRDLAEEVSKGRFREDLYYRINVLTIHLPPLRRRDGDLPLLIEHFAGPGWRIDADVIPALSRYGWPGNVRQLRNAIERAKILADDEVIRLANFPPEVLRRIEDRPPSAVPAGAPVDLDERNRLHVAETYRRHGGNKTRTARALGVSRRALYRLLEKYGIADSGEDAAGVSSDAD